MAKTYNGRFELPKAPKEGVGWLIAGIVLIAIRPINTVAGHNRRSWRAFRPLASGTRTASWWSAFISIAA